MSTPLTPTVAWARLAQALRQRRPVQVSYHGRQRTVCPHALGWKNHRAMLLAYQADGHTSPEAHTDPRKRWRCLYLDHIEDVAVAENTAPWQTADNYNASRPFPTTVEVIVAISPDEQSHRT